MRDISTTRYQRRLAFQILLSRLEHFLREINCAVAGRFRPNNGATPRRPFAGKDPGEFVLELLVHTEKEADLARADPDVARRDICIRPYVPKKFAHERLAKACHFEIALALRIEIRAAFRAAHRQCRQRILKDLFEGEEFENAKIDCGMKSQPTFVGADRAVHLHAEAAIDVQIACVILPGHAKHDHALRLDDSLEDFGFPVLRMSI